MTQTASGSTPLGSVGSGTGSTGSGPRNGHSGRRTPFGPPPKVGAAEAAKAVAEDASTLIKAEVALAKAEVMQSVKAKATGGGMLAAAGALVAVAGLGLLITIGFVLAEVAGLPGWASALIVSVGLILIAAVLGMIGVKKLKTEISIDTTKANVEEDVAWTKERLTSR